MHRAALHDTRTGLVMTAAVVSTATAVIAGRTVIRLDGEVDRVVIARAVVLGTVAVGTMLIVVVDRIGPTGGRRAAM